MRWVSRDEYEELAANRLKPDDIVPGEPYSMVYFNAVFDGSGFQEVVVVDECDRMDDGNYFFRATINSPSHAKGIKGERRMDPTGWILNESSIGPIPSGYILGLSELVELELQ